MVLQKESLVNLTTEQKNWLVKREIKVDKLYMFPRWGFRVHSFSDRSKSDYLSTNPFTRSLDHEFFVSKEVLANGLVRGNFLNKPVKQDFYMESEQLAQRDFVEKLFLKTAIPFMMIYNLFKR